MKPIWWLLNISLIYEHGRIYLEVTFWYELYWFFLRSLIYLVAGSWFAQILSGMSFIPWSQIRHWFATPTSFVPLLPWYILESGQIVGQRFCGWVGVHTSLTSLAFPNNTPRWAGKPSSSCCAYGETEGERCYCNNGCEPPDWKCLLTNSLASS